MVGAVVGGRYRVLRRLGRGGMGDVYEALDENTTRRCAIKVIRARYAADPEARARFEAEPRVTWSIDSTHFVVVFDAGVDHESGTPFIVMELLEGEDLQQRLERAGPRPPAEVVDHLGQVALALARMHALGVVHRDLKPSNLFWDNRDAAAPRIKVLDLGIAKVLSETGEGTRPGLGSTPYMAPEQALGIAVGPSTDLYSLGLIAFTLLTGTPYSMECQLTGTEVPATLRARELGAKGKVPPAFDAWFARATTRQPGQRFARAGRMVHALATALGVEPPPWLPDDPNAPLDLEQDPRGAATAETEPGVAATHTSGQAATTAALAPTADAVLPPPDARDPPATRRGFGKRALTTAGVGALATVLVGGWWAMGGGRSATSASGPLAAADAVLACPILAVEAEPTRWGWLGAAAAALVCERARVILGGVAARTRVPAELLDLGLTTAPDEDSYNQPDARDRSLAAARQRAQAYVDGKVRWTGSQFQVELALHRPDGSTIARGVAEDRALPGAVRGAMQPMIDAGALPTMAPDPVVADFSRAPDGVTLLRLIDLKLALTSNAGQIDDECAWLPRSTSDLASFLLHICRYQVGAPPSPVDLPGRATPGAWVARARVDSVRFRHIAPGTLPLLEALYAGERSTWGRSVIASTLSCLHEKARTGHASEWAHRAVQAERKNPTGEWCGPWGQLMSVSIGTRDEKQAATDWRTWAPWESTAWQFAARNAGADPARALDFSRRAYLLAPLDTNIAGDLAAQLLGQGNHAEVDAIARRLDSSPHQVHKLTASLLRIQAATVHRQFATALQEAEVKMLVQPTDAGWTRAQRITIARHAVAIAVVLGRADIAETAAGNFLNRSLPPMTGAFADEIPQMIAICLRASPATAQRCFEELETAPGIGGITVATRQLLDGARAFARGELAAAAAKWHPLLVDAPEHVDLVDDAMVLAFAAAGKVEQVVQVVERSRSRAVLFGGATMAMARAAQVARQLGDPRLNAVALATAVRDSWTATDASGEVLVEMRDLVNNRLKQQ